MQVLSRDAAGNESAYSATRTVTINIQTTPANGATVLTLRPTFAWALVPGATQYQVQVATDSGFTDIKYTSPNIAGTVARHILPLPSPLTVYGTYYWRVNVNRGAASGNVIEASPFSRTITLSPAAAAAPILVAPNTGSATADTTPDLSWNPVAAIAGITYTYELQVDNQSTFASPEFTETVVSASTPISTTVTTTLTSGTYYWRVRAKNNFNVVGAWSAVRTFIVDVTPFGVPTLSTPANGAALVAQSTTFTWVAIAGATYEIQLDTVNPPAHTYTATTASFVPPGVLLPTTYYWRVRSKDAVGNMSAWSSTYTLNLSSPTTVAPPLNSYPTVTPTLTWSPISWADEYEIQVDDHSTFASINYTTMTASNSVVLGALSEGTYYWRVRAQDSVGNWGAWSQVYSFSIP